MFKDPREVRKELKKVIRLVGSQEALAVLLGISPSTVARRVKDPNTLTYREARGFSNIARHNGMTFSLEAPDETGN